MLSDREIRGCEYANIDCTLLVIYIHSLSFLKVHRHQVSIRFESLTSSSSLLTLDLYRWTWYHHYSFQYVHFIAYLNTEKRFNDMMQSKVVVVVVIATINSDEPLTENWQKKKKASSLSSIFFLLLFFSLQWLIIYSSVYVEYNYVLRCIGALSYIYMRVWANCYFFLLGFFFIFNKTCCICFVLRSNPFLVMRALAFKLPDDEMWE